MLKIPFPKLGFLWPAGVIRHHKSGLRFSTEVRQNHSQRKLERVYYFFFISVTGTSLNIYVYIASNLICCVIGTSSLEPWVMGFGAAEKQGHGGAGRAMLIGGLWDP